MAKKYEYYKVLRTSTTEDLLNQAKQITGDKTDSGAFVTVLNNYHKLRDMVKSMHEQLNDAEREKEKLLELNDKNKNLLMKFANCLEDINGYKNTEL